MAISFGRWQGVWSRVNNRPGLLFLPIILAAAGYIGWQGIREWFDRPLPASTVAAHQLQVDQAKSQALQERLNSYRAP